MSSGAWNLITQDQINKQVDQYINKDTRPNGLIIAVGSITQDNAAGTILYSIAENCQLYNQLGLIINQSNVELGDIRFELASVTKTFTATLLALSGIASDIYGTYSKNFGYYNENSGLNSTSLSAFMSYSSGLPQDNSDIEGQNFTEPFASPPPDGFSIAALRSFLRCSVVDTSAAGSYGYSNFGFAVTAQILASFYKFDTPSSPEFRWCVTTKIFNVLKMKSLFNGDSPMDEVIAGYTLDTSGNVQNWYGLGAQLPYPTPGWSYFPAYEGAGGVIASPNDMLIWLRYNMGLISGCPLNDLLPVLQTSSGVVAWTGTQTCQGWFYTSADSINKNNFYWKDGWLNSTESYIAFAEPVNGVSPGGVFVLINGSNISDPSNGEPLATSLANDFLNLMSGNEVSTDKSTYPSTFKRARQAKP